MKTKLNKRVLMESIDKAIALTNYKSVDVEGIKKILLHMKTYLENTY